MSDNGEGGSERSPDDDRDDGHHHPIHFSVDGEDFTTEAHELTPDVIIKDFAGLKPHTHYLVQIEGHEKTSYKGLGHVPIPIHECARFQVISLGPTPVSDGPIRTGTEVFVEGLRSLGYHCSALLGQPDHVFFDYEVMTGRLTGRKVRVGLVVPSDFPLTPPSGPHVSPDIHPVGLQGAHPAGCIHRDQAKPFADGAGGQWQYWSRPHPSWSESKKTVAAYMNHIWQLWDTQ